MHLVLTGEDVAHLGEVRVPAMREAARRHEGADPQHTAICAGERVKHVGDAVAFIVADSLAQAQDAAELIEIDWEDLPANGLLEKALDPDAPLVWPELGSNRVYTYKAGDVQATADAFASAAHVSKIAFVNNRLVSNPMEPRAAIGEYDRATEDYTLYTTSQAPHVHRLLIGAMVLQLPEHKLRVVAPDVGGGFGTKAFNYIEHRLTLWAARKLLRPVKWTCERSEAVMADEHGRDNIGEIELALDKDGRFLG